MRGGWVGYKWEGGGYKSFGGMDPNTFAPSDVIHLFLMEIGLVLSVGDLGGAAAPDDDEVGEFSDEELFDLPAKKQAHASLMQLWKK